LAQSLEIKGEKMSGLLDGVSTLKRDLRDLNADLVELKADVKALSAAQSAQGDDSWWSQAAKWPYLPAFAALLSAVALGVAFTR
jgi:hypothetical protein